MYSLWFKNKKIIHKIKICDTFWSRLVGYMFADRPGFTALLFPNVQSIHMFFVRFPLAVIVLDKKYRVLDCFVIRPWQVSRWYRQAAWIVETPDLHCLKRISRGSILRINS